MADIIRTYAALSPSSSRTDVAAVFNSIIDAKPFTFDKSSRVELIKSIITDVKACGSKAKLSSKDATLALLSVKTLGKDPSGSAYIAQASVLSTLLGLATTFIKDDPDAASEALRCIANALLLIEQARSTFISDEVNGGDTCILMLEKSSSADHIFILSRILFLSTAAGPSYLETIVDTKHHGRTIVEILSSKLDFLSTANRNGTPSAKEATIDLLKFIFNILLHYPKLTEEEPQHTLPNGEEKIMGDFWSSKLDGLLPPLLRIFNTLPPTSPAPITAPLTHVIHSLITIPVNNSLKPIWLGTSPPSGRNSTSSSPKIKTPSESVPGSRSDSPTQTPTSPKPSTLDRALSVIAAGRRSLSRTPSPSTQVPFDVLQRAYDLFEQGLSYYFPDSVDPDDADLRKRAKAESQDTVEDILSPIVVLITRLCMADEGTRVRVRQWLVPDDLDRSSPLEQRPDTLGRCLRILSCVYHARLKDSVGEMMYAMADSDASVLSALVGYGNVAGFLFNKGVLSAPPASSSSSSAPQTTASGEQINPITGTTLQPKSDLPEMTEEEKEREMEKLFVLFDRLEKNGALPPDQNPIRKAIHEVVFNQV
ncbi:Synembryn [Psilocybe cubensis]|uniref:Guanine nucleotide exchange factor n=2 Tax=Psilocybe cubensis TaxID=181762 RepID=A0A8H7Y1J9_PSICU|nr:Synembryn [Psilocybe cubensis]KAH9482875.1 Synembryn [Psilocybe cubensis]